MQNKRLVIRPCDKKELSALLGVSRFTLNKWLEPLKEDIGKVKGRYFTPNQVELIIRRLGLPREYEIENHL